MPHLGLYVGAIYIGETTSTTTSNSDLFNGKLCKIQLYQSNSWGLLCFWC